MLRKILRVAKALPVAMELLDLVDDEVETLIELIHRMRRDAKPGDLDDSRGRLTVITKSDEA